MFIYDAAMRYADEGTPLVILAGSEYGAAVVTRLGGEGHALLGVCAVLAESFERIHRSNLVGMGVLPLQFERESGRVAQGPTGRGGVHDRGPRHADEIPREVTVRRAREFTARECKQSTRRRSSSTTATAAYCRSCFGSCSARSRRRPRHREARPREDHRSYARVPAVSPARRPRRRTSLTTAGCSRPSARPITRPTTSSSWTSYEIEVDGKPVTGHLGVSNDGRVHYHLVPNLSFESAVDLVKQVIDTFPDEFLAGDGGDGDREGDWDDDGGHHH